MTSAETLSEVSTFRSDWSWLGRKVLHAVIAVRIGTKPTTAAIFRSRERLAHACSRWRDTYGLAHIVMQANRQHLEHSASVV